MSEFIDVHCHLFDVSHIPMKTLLRRYGALLSIGLEDWKFSTLDERVRKLVETTESTTLQILEQLVTEIREFLTHEQTPMFNPDTIILTPLVMYFEKEDERKPLDKQASDVKEAIKTFCSLPENSNVFVYPFIGIDPMLPGAVHVVKTYITRPKGQMGAQNGEFIGVKIYPPLNVDVFDSSVDALFAHCELNDIPITTHGSHGGFVSDDIHLRTAAKYSNPRRWEGVLKNFPNLRLNLAHLGGLKYHWIKTIDGYIKAGYPNVYTDVAYKLSHTRHCLRIVNAWVADPQLAPHLLFGTDYYAVIQEKEHYMDYAGPFKRGIAENDFVTLSETNPKAFLRL